MEASRGQDMVRAGNILEEARLSTAVGRTGGGKEYFLVELQALLRDKDRTTAALRGKITKSLKEDHRL